MEELKNLLQKKRSLLMILLAILLIAAGTAAIVLPERRNPEPNENQTAGNEHKEISLWILGDSLAAFHTNEYKTQGWGEYLQQYLTDSSVTVRNSAVSGTSSLSFTQLATYSLFMEDLQAGDYVIIQYGINDAAQEDRCTNPYENSNTPGSFQYILKHDYIKPILEKGGHVILSTSVAMPGSTDPETGEEYSIYSEHVRATRTLAKECQREGLDVLLLDANALTSSLYLEIGIEEALKFHGADQVHYNNYGAAYVAGLIAEELQKLGVPFCKDIRSIEKVMAD